MSLFIEAFKATRAGSNTTCIWLTKFLAAPCLWLGSTSLSTQYSRVLINTNDPRPHNWKGPITTVLVTPNSREITLSFKYECNSTGNWANTYSYVFLNDLSLSLTKLVLCWAHMYSFYDFNRVHKHLVWCKFLLQVLRAHRFVQRIKSNRCIDEILVRTTMLTWAQLVPDT